MDAVDRADLDARVVLGADARLCNHVGHVCRIPSLLGSIKKGRPTTGERPFYGPRPDGYAAADAAADRGHRNRRARRCCGGCWPRAGPSAAWSVTRGGSAPSGSACRSRSATSATPISFRHALRDVDTVIHLASVIRDQRAGSIEELAGFATVRLLRAAEAAGVEPLPVLLDAQRRHPEPVAVHARQGRRRAGRGAVLAGQHGVRAVDHLRAQRPVRDAAGADVAAAGDADPGRRPAPLCADLVRGRRRLRAGDAARRSRRARGRRRPLSSWPGPTSSPTARSSSSCSPRRHRRRRIVADPAEPDPPRAEGRRADQRPRRVRHLGRGRTARRAAGLAAHGTADCRRASASSRGRWSRCSASEPDASSVQRGPAAPTAAPPPAAPPAPAARPPAPAAPISCTAAAARRRRGRAAARRPAGR